MKGKSKWSSPLHFHPGFLNSNQELRLPKAPAYHEIAKGQCVLLKPNLASQITHKMQTIDIIQSYSATGIQETQAEPTLARRSYPQQEFKVDKLGMDSSPTS